MSDYKCNRKCELTPESIETEASHYLDCPIWKRIDPWLLERSIWAVVPTAQHVRTAPQRTASDPLDTVWNILAWVGCSAALIVGIVIFAAWFEVI